jgi:hypothetical protein
MSSKSFVEELPEYLRKFAANVNLSSSVLGDGLQWPAGAGYDYMQMDIVKFVKTTELQFRTTPATQTSGEEGETATEDESGLENSFGIDNLGESTFLSNIQSQKTNVAKLGTVILPIPNNVQYQDSPNYKEGSGVVGKLLPSIGKGFANADSAESITKNLQALAGGGKIGVAMKLLDSIVGQGGSQQVTQNGFGKIMNPYTEQVFNGVGMRQFTFDWKLVPRNSGETAAIQRIIKTIRANSLPDYNSRLGLKEGSEGDSGNLSDRWLTVPNIFRIGWKNGEDNSEITSLPKLKPCVLTQVSINYTPDAIWATYKGADPVAYTMTLSFTETEIITSTEVKENNY